MPDRLTVTLLPENRENVFHRGTRFIDCFAGGGDSHALAARMNNELVSLMDGLSVNCRLAPVLIGETAGMRVYRNSLTFLFEMASLSLYPSRRLVIGHSLGHGFFYRFRDGGPNGTPSNAAAIQERMHHLVAEESPIIPDELSWADAVEVMGRRTHSNAALLVREMNEPRVGIWRCGDHVSLRHSPLAHNTGVLTTFAVEIYEDGFLLRYPPSDSPQRLGERDDEPKLFTIYEEHKKWGEILGVTSTASLNVLSRHLSQAREFIQTAEALHDRKIAELASMIAAGPNRAKAVMIAGPSSSGKTTFTKKLALSLKSSGLKPQLISLDDYYKEGNEIPLDEDGKPDFEVIEALDLEQFKENLNNLFSGREAEIPIFDFKKVGGRLPEGRKVRLDGDGILLFEGIHGLNPELTRDISANKTFRIYISALTQLNIDDHHRIPTRDNRLIRRIVRDHQFRRYPAINTLKIWPSVRRGEERHIFPWQGSADAMFNSALDYELAILKVFAEPLLRTVSPKEPEYGEARRLMSFLRNFSPFPVEEVPELSILREFIGRSGFHY